MKRFIWVLVVVTLFGACRSPKVITIEKPVIVKDTIERVVVRVDSVEVYHHHSEKESDGVIIIHDSVDRWHNNVIHDSVDRVVEVPVEVEVPTPIEVIKEVPRERSLIEKILIGVGCATIVSLIYIVWRKKSK